MATPTILRIKRRKDQDPSDVLVVSAKKRKSEDEEQSENIKILKLAATVEVHDEPEKLSEAVGKILSKRSMPNFEELKQRYKKSLLAAGNAHEKMKAATVEKRTESRYKFVAQKRAIKLEDLDSAADSGTSSKDSKELFHLFDVVTNAPNTKSEDCDSKKQDKISCNGIEMIREYVDPDADSGYVYDVYYSDSAFTTADQDFDDSLLDSLLSIQPFNTGESYDQYRNDLDEFKYEDDEDSNDEMNENNDYPDEEDDSEDESLFKGYGDDSDMGIGSGMKGLGLGDEEDSNCSSDEDQLLYTKAFDEDASFHGVAYAKYKRNMLQQFYGEEEGDSDAESDDD